MMRHGDFMLRGQNIVIISPEEWGDNLLSKHHIALTLAQWNNNVWFLCPGGNLSQKTSGISPNLFFLHHEPLRGINRLPVPLARLIARLDVSRILKMVGQKVDIVWSFDPYCLQFLKLFNARLNIYHPVDNHYTALEKRIVKEADVILTNSSLTLSRLHHANKFKVGHGVASHFFEHKDIFPLPGDFHVKVGYVGNLNNRLFAFDVLLQLARAHSKVGFYLVGPRAGSNLSSNDSPFFDWTEADRLPNIFWLGQQPSSRIPSFLSQMDILLVLYRADEHGFTVSPHKTLEYLSSGKLVITPVHEENAAIDHLILQAKALSELPQVFDHVLENQVDYFTPDKCAARISYSYKMSYTNRLKEIESICKNTIRTNE